MHLNSIGIFRIFFLTIAFDTAATYIRKVTHRKLVHNAGCDLQHPLVNILISTWRARTQLNERVTELFTASLVYICLISETRSTPGVLGLGSLGSGGNDGGDTVVLNLLRTLLVLCYKVTVLPNTLGEERERERERDREREGGRECQSGQGMGREGGRGKED